MKGLALTSLSQDVERTSLKGGPIGGLMSLNLLDKYWKFLILITQRELVKWRMRVLRFKKLLCLQIYTND